MAVVPHKTYYVVGHDGCRYCFAFGEAEIASLGTIVEGIAVVCYVVGHNGDCRYFSFGDTIGKCKT